MNTANPTVAPLTIAYFPSDDSSNAYTQSMRDILATLGRLERFEFRSRLLGLLKGDFRRVDIIVVNWIDNDLINNRSGRLSFLGMCKLMLKTLVIRASARRRIFVRHNFYPHAASARSAPLAKRLVDAYEKLFDVVFVHSGANVALSENGRGAQVRRYVPHPLYRRACSAPAQAPLPLVPPCYFLAFGRIVRYKKLEQLISAFPNHRALVICGASEDSDYAAGLASTGKPNIFVAPGFLAEPQAQALVAGAQAVVIAHAEPNVVVSGSFFYALSLHRPVFAVRTPFLEWISSRLGKDVLTLGDDISHLCRLIQDAECAPISAASHQQVEREFGDAAVAAALTPLLRAH